MADQVTETLLSLAQSFSVTQSAVGSGAYSFALDLLGPSGGTRGLEVIENIIETVIQNVPVDLNFLLKDVRFATSPIADQVTIGGQPILNILTPGLTTTETNPPLGPGIAGAIGALSGTIPLPVQQNVANPLAVTFDIQWSVVDENGNTATDNEWRIGGTQGQGGIIPIQAGGTLQPLRLDFMPPVLELTATTR